MLEFNNVSAQYGKIQALHEVSLSVRKGEIVTLIGANGAGKTTLLSTLCGEPRATTGEIRYLGENITALPTAQIMRKDIALVPEGRRVFGRMTVEENLAMGGFLHPKRSIRHGLLRYMSFSRGFRSAAISGRVPCPAVNSRCWLSAVR